MEILLSVIHKQKYELSQLRSLVPEVPEEQQSEELRHMAYSVNAISTKVGMRMCKMYSATWQARRPDEVNRASEVTRFSKCMSDKCII